MNLVGKILTLLIFVMSIAFMVAAVMLYQTRKNWRDSVMRPASEVEAGKPLGYKHQLDKAKAEKRKLSEEFDRMQSERDVENKAHAAVLAKLQSRVLTMEKEQNANSQSIVQLRDIEAKSLASMETAHLTLKDMRGETTTLSGNIRKAELSRDDSFKSAMALADEVHQLATEKKRLEARSEELIRDNDRMRTILRSNDMNPDGNPAEILPNVKGIVLAMPGRGIMEVSIGEDDGLQTGHHLEVYRIGSGVSTYLGRVKVVSTAPDRAVCEILPEYRKGAMRTGDRVASKLE